MGLSLSTWQVISSARGGAHLASARISTSLTKAFRMLGSIESGLSILQQAGPHVRGARRQRGRAGSREQGAGSNRQPRPQVGAEAAAHLTATGGVPSSVALNTCTPTDCLRRRRGAARHAWKLASMQCAEPPGRASASPSQPNASSSQRWLAQHLLQVLQSSGKLTVP